jgi:mannose-6-phosphate isomerase-like protein (cupin superfamily)
MKPGEQGSLQSHENFDELWIMLTDGAEVQLGDEVRQPKAGDEIYIPRRTRHRLTNTGSAPFRMLEVAYGDVQDEDKVRYEDRYGRA